VIIEFFNSLQKSDAGFLLSNDASPNIPASDGDDID